MIAFYRSLDRDNFDPVNAFNTLAPICGFPSNFTDAQDWSLQVFDSYGSFQHVGEWESPRLHSTPQISQRCGTTTRSWPQAFRSIQPIYDNSIWTAEPRLAWWRIGPYYAQMNPNGTLDMLSRSSKSGPPYLGSTVNLSPIGVVSAC